MDELSFNTLVGKTLVSVRNVDDQEVVFLTDANETFKLLHYQDCCESVVVESITGDLADLVGTPILMAEEASSADDPADVSARKAAEKAANPEQYHDWTDSQTWTFYKLRTIKGSVDIRWHGESNGYYSEAVDFVKVA